MKTIKSIFIVFLVIFCFVIPASAADYLPDDVQLLTEPQIWDISYLPALPKVYNDFSVYPYRLILFNSIQNKYYLYLLKGEPYHISTDYLFSSTAYPDNVKDGLGFVFDNNLIKKSWLPSTGFGYVHMSNYKIYFSNVDIKNDYSGKPYYIKSHKDFTFVSISLGRLQGVIRDNLKVLMPFVITLLGSFIMIRFISKYFGNDKRKKKINQKVRGHIKRGFKK